MVLLLSTLAALGTGVPIAVSMFRPLLLESTSRSQWTCLCVNRMKATVMRFSANDAVLNPACDVDAEQIAFANPTAAAYGRIDPKRSHGMLTAILAPLGRDPTGNLAQPSRIDRVEKALAAP